MDDNPYAVPEPVGQLAEGAAGSRALYTEAVAGLLIVCGLVVVIVEAIWQRDWTLGVAITLVVVGLWLAARLENRRKAVTILIRIVGTPPGEAPEDVREAWRGLTLPAEPCVTTVRTAGVLSGPRNWWNTVGWLIRGKHDKSSGYVVDAAAAIAVLSKRNPAAADWWKTHVPHLLKPGRKLLFHTHVCEELT